MLLEHSIAASLVFVREHPATRAKDRSTTRSIMPSEISLEWMPKYRLSRSNLRTAQCCARYGTVFLIVKLSGSTPLNRGRGHVVTTCRCLGGRPRRLGGIHGGGGTWYVSSSHIVH
jgi:hypothetical protein